MKYLKYFLNGFRGGVVAGAFIVTAIANILLAISVTKSTFLTEEGGK